MTRKRRQFSPEDKITIIRRHLVEGIPVSQVCREHDLSPNQFYIWQRELFENGHLVFQPKRKDARLAKLEAENDKLREKLEKKNEVVAELMQEYVQLIASSRKLVGGFARKPFQRSFHQPAGAAPADPLVTSIRKGTTAGVKLGTT